MTLGLDTSGLKCVSVSCLSLALMMLGIIMINTQFVIFPDGGAGVLSQGGIVMIVTILSVLSAILMAYKGNARQGMVLAISSIALLMTLYSTLTVLVSICLIVGLAFFIIESFIKDSKDFVGIFGIIILAYLVVALITGMEVVAFLGENPVILGAISLVAAVFGLFVAHTALNESDEDEDDSNGGYTY